MLEIVGAILMWYIIGGRCCTALNKCAQTPVLPTARIERWIAVGLASIIPISVALFILAGLFGFIYGTIAYIFNLD